MKNKIALAAAFLAATSYSTAEIVINDFLSFEGFVDMSYTHWDADFDGSDESDNSFGLDQVEISWLFDFDPVTAQIDLNYLGDQATNGPGGEVEQAFATYHMDNGSAITAGRYASMLGFEAFEPTGLYQYSTAYTFTQPGIAGFSGGFAATAAQNDVEAASAALAGQLLAAIEAGEDFPLVDSDVFDVQDDPNTPDVNEAEKAIIDAFDAFLAGAFNLSSVDGNDGNVFVSSDSELGESNTSSSDQGFFFSSNGDEEEFQSANGDLVGFAGDVETFFDALAEVNEVLGDENATKQELETKLMALNSVFASEADLPEGVQSISFESVDEDNDPATLEAPKLVVTLDSGETEELTGEDVDAETAELLAGTFLNNGVIQASQIALSTIYSQAINDGLNAAAMLPGYAQGVKYTYEGDNTFFGISVQDGIGNYRGRLGGDQDLTGDNGGYGVEVAGSVAFDNGFTWFGGLGYEDGDGTDNLESEYTKWVLNTYGTFETGAWIFAGEVAYGEVDREYSNGTIGGFTFTGADVETEALSLMAMANFAYSENASVTGRISYIDYETDGLVDGDQVKWTAAHGYAFTDNLFLVNELSYTDGEIDNLGFDYDEVLFATELIFSF